LDAVLERIHRRVAAPVLTDLVVEDAGLAIEPDSITPSHSLRLPDLFAGAPLVVSGRWHGRGPSVDRGATARLQPGAGQGGAGLALEPPGPPGAVAVRGRLASGREWRGGGRARPAGNRAPAGGWGRGRPRPPRG